MSLLSLISVQSQRLKDKDICRKIDKHTREILTHLNRDIHGVTHVPSAMFTKADYSPAAMASRWKGYFEGPYGFPKVYAVILEKGAPYYRKIFLHLLQNHSIHSNKSIIVHCTAGKDRTGIFCMLLLGLCGVDDEIIANEYGLSSLGYWGKIYI